MSRIPFAQVDSPFRAFLARGAGASRRLREAVVSARLMRAPAGTVIYSQGEGACARHARQSVMS
jgi:hypothetical protein